MGLSFLGYLWNSKVYCSGIIPGTDGFAGTTISAFPGRHRGSNFSLLTTTGISCVVQKFIAGKAIRMNSPSCSIGKSCATRADHIMVSFILCWCITSDIPLMLTGSWLLRCGRSMLWDAFLRRLRMGKLGTALISFIGLLQIISLIIMLRENNIVFRMIAVFGKTVILGAGFLVLEERT